jgi:hypothetical protein
VKVLDRARACVRAAETREAEATRSAVARARDLGIGKVRETSVYDELAETNLITLYWKVLEDYS